jgi:folate-dependent phosphoribosylglycinamide formyltransferase PurN
MNSILKPLLIVGTQLRHKYFLSVLLKNFSLSGVIFYERSLVQPPPALLKNKEQYYSNYSKEDIELESLHLSNLKSKEEEYFLEEVNQIDLHDIPVLTVSSQSELNSKNTIAWLKNNVDSNVMLDYGSRILSNEFLSILPKWKINLHGGLSPYYKGSATLLWPIYMQQPELVGTTLHLLSEKIDAGEIIQHSRPNIGELDSVADIGCKAIISASSDAVNILNKLQENNTLELYPQSTGKLFLERDYKPSIIAVVNELMKRGLIQKYLENKEKIDMQYKFVNQL